MVTLFQSSLAVDVVNKVFVAGEASVGAGGGLAVVKDQTSDQALVPLGEFVRTRQYMRVFAVRAILGVYDGVVVVALTFVMENVLLVDTWML